MNLEQQYSTGRRLKGWTRLGVVLSGLWLFTVGAWTTYEYLHWDDFCYDSDKSDRCVHQGLFVSWKLAYAKTVTVASDAKTTKAETLEPAEDAGLELLRKFGTREGSKYEKQFERAHFFAALVLPVILGWLLCWLFVVLYHWVRQGFTQ